MPRHPDTRHRALRAAAVAAGLAASITTTGCDRMVARVLDGQGMDGTTCAGWSIRHGSTSHCCEEQGAGYDDTTGQCVWLLVPGPFVPPAIAEPV